jgi:nicotinate-nucleotide adenylyltransferase
MKIGIYGGTFNPIHYGHLRTAEDVLEILSLDKMLFIPSGETPFDKPDLEKAGHRYKMVKAAIEGNSHFGLSNIEIKARGKSYTVDTIRNLRDKYRDSELFFILGIDAFLDLPGWKQGLYVCWLVIFPLS